MITSSGRPSLGSLVTQACLLEAQAPKLGNVYPGVSFADMEYYHFEKSSQLIGPIFDQWESHSAGWLIERSVEVTRESVGVNTNLGMILLLGPLVKGVGPLYRDGCIAEIEIQLRTFPWTEEDTKGIYRAIQVAHPGGLGRADEMDVADAPPLSILEAMQLAAHRDSIASEYCNGFNQCQLIANRLLHHKLHATWDEAICEVQLEWLARQGDSLILRKCGEGINGRVREMAKEIIDAKKQSSSDIATMKRDFDFYLRSDGNRLNPGTTADLIAGGLFLALFQLACEA